CGPHYPRKCARTESSRSRHVRGTSRCAVRGDLADTNLGSLPCAFYPTHDRTTGGTARDIDPAHWVSFVNANLFAETPAGIRRREKIDLWLIIGRCKPRHCHTLSIRRNGGTVYRAAIDLPAVLRQCFGLGP